MRNNNLIRRDFQVLPLTSEERRAGVIAWTIVIALVLGVLVWAVRA